VPYACNINIIIQHYIGLQDTIFCQKTHTTGTLFMLVLNYANVVVLVVGLKMLLRCFDGASYSSCSALRSLPDWHLSGNRFSFD